MIETRFRDWMNVSWVRLQDKANPIFLDHLCPGLAPRAAPWRWSMAHAHRGRTRVLDIKWVSLADFSGFVCEVEHKFLGADVNLSTVLICTTSSRYSTLHSGSQAGGHWAGPVRKGIILASLCHKIR